MGCTGAVRAACVTCPAGRAPFLPAHDRCGQYKGKCVWRKDTAYLAATHRRVSGRVTSVLVALETHARPLSLVSPSPTCMSCTNAARRSSGLLARRE